MSVNKENMEKWIEALETYQGKQAIGTLRDDAGNLCAMGVGLQAMDPWAIQKIRNAWTSESRDAWYTLQSKLFPWLDISSNHLDGMILDISLKPDNSGFNTVTLANDRGRQDFWTIAQRLRETYLKDES